MNRFTTAQSREIALPVRDHDAAFRAAVVVLRSGRLKPDEVVDESCCGLALCLELLGVLKGLRLRFGWRSRSPRRHVLLLLREAYSGFCRCLSMIQTYLLVNQDEVLGWMIEVSGHSASFE